MTDKEFNEKLKELVSLLNQWNTEEGAELLRKLLYNIVNDYERKEGEKCNYFRYCKVFSIFSEAQSLAADLEESRREAQAYDEGVSKIINDLYEQKLAEGVSEEEAYKFANEEVKNYL